MKIKKQSIKESLELLEASKITTHYEKLGYKVETEHKLQAKNKIFEVDLYAWNDKSGDKIIFEIASPKKRYKDQIKRILQKRNEYLNHFPDTRFVLVVIAKERKIPKTFKSELNNLLLNYIKNNKNNLIQKYVISFVEYEDVSDLEIINFNFNDFKTIILQGTANLKFWLNIKNEEFEGKSLSDGVPFTFNIELLLNSQNEIEKGIYRISEKSKINFDFSEFTID